MRIHNRGSGSWGRAPLRFCLIIAALLAVSAARSRAGDFHSPSFELNTFGTLGAVYQDSGGLVFHRNIGQGHGARAGQIDLGTDSLLGLQLSGHASFGLDAQVQTIVRRNVEGVWRPELARAFLRYRPNPSLMIRAGRIGLSMYLLGDALDVGYSYLTIRPPVEVYGMLPSDQFDGADVTLSRPIGNGVGRVRLLGGLLPYQQANPDGSVTNVDNDKLLGVTADYLQGNWQTRAALVLIQPQIDSGTKTLAEALSATGVAQASVLAGELTHSPQNAVAAEIGTDYTGNRLRATAVLARLDSNFITGPKANTGYVLIGWRVGRVTPYALFSFSDSFAKAHSAGLPPLPMFAPLDAAAVYAQTADQTTQHHFALGLRYDFAPHMDLKAQIDRVWLHQSAVIFDYNTPPPGHAALTVVGVALDFAY